MTVQYIEELIRKYADGSATDDEVSKLMDWYRHSNIDEVQWPSGNVSEKSIVSQRMLHRLQNEISVGKARVIKFSWSRVAAILLVCIGVATLVYFLRPADSRYITLINPAGKIQQFNLPDGSNVWLNASTTLRYAASFETDRQVELDGEAYFDVTHDQAHPFVVSAGGVRTTVLGTRFNIKAYESVPITRVSVLSGRVRVEDSANELAVLAASNQLRYNRQSLVPHTSFIDTNSILAWKSGQLKFEGETFSEIASAIENWYGIKINFANEGISSCRYYLNINQTVSLEKFLSMMAHITEMEYDFNKANKTVTVSGKGCGETK